MNEKNKRTMINIISQCVSFAVNLGISFLLTPYITRHLGKDVYGFVGLAYQVLSYISVFIVAFNTMLNIFVATAYYKNDIKKANEYFSSVLIVDMILSLVLIAPLLFICIRLEAFLDVPSSALWDIKLLWILIFANFIIGLAFGPYGTGLFIKNRLDLSALRGIESNLIKAVILVLCFALFSPRVWYVGFAAVICGIYVVIINIIYHHRLTPEIRLSFGQFHFSAIKEIVSVGVWNTINSLTSILMNGLDLIVSNLFIGALGMGYISYAQTVPTQIAALIATIKSAFVPQLTKVYAESKDDFSDFVKEVQSAMQVCGFLGSVPIIVFMVFGIDFYKLWLPTMSNEEVIIINVLAIMILIPTLLDVYISPLYNVNSITKKIKIPVLVTFGISVVNVVAEIGLVKYTTLGIYAIELVTAILMTGKVFLFTPIYASRLLSQKWYIFYLPLFRGIIANALSLGCALGIHMIFKSDSWLSLIILCFVSVILGYLVNYFVVLTKETKQKVKIFLMKKIKRF